jgi:hypothetical protein
MGEGSEVSSQYSQENRWKREDDERDGRQGVEKRLAVKAILDAIYEEAIAVFVVEDDEAEIEDLRRAVSP